MIAQIDATQGRENQIMVMLDLLPLRTSQVYDKIADALHLSGHTLLADFLREEDVSEHPLNMEDLFQRLPFLTKNIKDTEKNSIEAYMLEKIQASVLSHTWQWNTKDKDKALTSKQEQLEQAFSHRQEMNRKQQQVLEAEQTAKEAREESLALRAELRALSENSSKLQQHMKGQIDTQIRFSVANDNIAQRLNQRLKTAEQTLKNVQDTLSTVVKISPRERERDLMKMAENPFHFLPEDVEVFVSHFKNLREIQTKHEKLMEERNSVLNQLGFSHPHDLETTSLLKAYQDFASEKQGDINNLKDEVARQKRLIDERRKKGEEEERKIMTAGTVWQHAIMSVMRKQLQDQKASLRKKDTTILIKDEEIVKLRGKNADLELNLAAKMKEANQALRALKLIEVHGGSEALPSDISHMVAGITLDSSRGHTFPPLRSSLSQQMAPSPSAGVPHSHQRPTLAVPSGVVVEANTPLAMYPAGLSTIPLAASHDDSNRHTSMDLRVKPPMRSTLGDLRAMHPKYPVSRGGGGVGLESGHSSRYSQNTTQVGLEASHGRYPVSRGGDGKLLEPPSLHKNHGPKRKLTTRVK